MLDAVVDRREMRSLIIKLLDFMVNPEIGATKLDVDINFAGRQNGYDAKAAKAALEEQPAESKFQNQEIRAKD